MKIKRVFAGTAAASLAVAATVMWAQGAERAVGGHWSAADIEKAYPAITAQAKKAVIGTGADRIVTTPGHAVYLVTKDKTYPELHEFDHDVFFVKEGGGTFQMGGELIDPKPGGSGNMSGSSIRGGQMMEVSAGDILYIPKNTPHVWHFREGQHVSYIAVKVTEK